MLIPYLFIEPFFQMDNLAAAQFLMDDLIFSIIQLTGLPESPEFAK